MRVDQTWNLSLYAANESDFKKDFKNDRRQTTASDRNRGRFRVSFEAASRGPGARIVRVGDSNQ